MQRKVSVGCDADPSCGTLHHSQDLCFGQVIICRCGTGDSVSEQSLPPGEQLCAVVVGAPRGSLLLVCCVGLCTPPPFLLYAGEAVTSNRYDSSESCTTRNFPQHGILTAHQSSVYTGDVGGLGGVARSSSRR